MKAGGEQRRGPRQGLEEGKLPRGGEEGERAKAQQGPPQLCGREILLCHLGVRDPREKIELAWRSAKEKL